MIAQGRISNALVGLVDIVPTLHELLDLPIPECVQGRSFRSLLTDSDTSHDFRDGIYSEYYNANPAVTSPQQERAYATMWRTRTHKIVVYHGQAFGELYDLEKDPDEFENLWDEPACADVRADLMKQCFDAAVFTMDPLPARTAGF